MVDALEYKCLHVRILDRFIWHRPIKLVLAQAQCAIPLGSDSFVAIDFHINYCTLHRKAAALLITHYGEKWKDLLRFTTDQQTTPFRQLIMHMPGIRSHKN